MTSDYEHLARLASGFATEVTMDALTWSLIYDYSERGEPPNPSEFAEITHLHAVSPDGWGSTEIAVLARTTDQRWITCVAWSDTSGFGCQQDVDWRIFPSREEAIAMGLDKEARGHLGLELPGERA